MATYRRTAAGGWRVEVAIKGQRASTTMDTKAECIAWARDKEAEFQAGGARAARRATVGDMMRLYAEKVSPSKAGARWETTRIDALCKRPIAKMKLSECGTPEWAAWRDERLKTVKGDTVNRELNLYSHCYAIARDEWKWLEKSPLTGLRRPKEGNGRKRRPTEDEITRLCFALGYDANVPPATKSARIAATFLFAIETAMRAGEIQRLDWPNVHIDQSYAHLPKTKNGDERDVPLSPAAIGILEQLRPLAKQFHGRVFGIEEGGHDALFRKACKRAMVEDLHFHDTRHEACTRLAKKVDVLTLAKILGHKDLNELMTYYNPTATEIAKRLH
jgi:integrase